MTRVRPARPVDAASWARLRAALWPAEPKAELRREVDQFFAGRLRHVRAVFMAEAESGRIVGLAEMNIRPYAEGCSTDRVAFLEGWYVEPQYRRRGIGAALIGAAERWAVKNRCSEFASNSLHDNELGRAAHLAVGFEEVEVTRHFRKELRLAADKRFQRADRRSAPARR